MNNCPYCNAALMQSIDKSILFCCKYDTNHDFYQYENGYGNSIITFFHNSKEYDFCIIKNNNTLNYYRETFIILDDYSCIKNKNIGQIIELYNKMNVFK